MKQLVILSGKGGTGKTSVAAAFAHLAAEGDDPFRAILVDADVDASNLELVLSPTVLETHEFMGGGLAVIDPEACEGLVRQAQTRSHPSWTPSPATAVAPVSTNVPLIPSNWSPKWLGSGFGPRAATAPSFTPHCDQHRRIPASW